jgi:hypothetical protein
VQQYWYFRGTINTLAIQFALLTFEILQINVDNGAENLKKLFFLFHIKCQLLKYITNYENVLYFAKSVLLFSSELISMINWSDKWSDFYIFGFENFGTLHYCLRGVRHCQPLRPPLNLLFQNCVNFVTRIPNE